MYSSGLALDVVVLVVVLVDVVDCELASVGGVVVWDVCATVVHDVVVVVHLE